MPDLGPSFTSAPVAIPAEARVGAFDRVDVVLDGLEQAGPSFEGHVFLNNPRADADTERIPATGYAGAFHVYGQGAAPGSAETSSGEIIAPITKRVIATDAVRAAMHDAEELTVTVVPVARSAGKLAPLRPERVSIIVS
jgi:hypothetical protein